MVAVVHDSEWANVVIKGRVRKPKNRVSRNFPLTTVIC